MRCPFKADHRTVPAGHCCGMDGGKILFGVWNYKIGCVGKAEEEGGWRRKEVPYNEKRCPFSRASPFLLAF